MILLGKNIFGATPLMLTELSGFYRLLESSTNFEWARYCWPFFKHDTQIGVVCSWKRNKKNTDAVKAIREKESASVAGISMAGHSFIRRRRRWDWRSF